MGNSGSRDTMGSKALVQQLVEQNKVMVFSKTYCPYCTKGKDALRRVLGANFGSACKVMELDTEAGVDVDGIQSVLGEMTGAATVPRVFIGGKCIGGGDDTARLERSGELAKLIAAAGVNL